MRGGESLQRNSLVHKQMLRVLYMCVLKTTYEESAFFTWNKMMDVSVLDLGLWKWAPRWKWTKEVGRGEEELSGKEG